MSDKVGAIGFIWGTDQVEILRPANDAVLRMTDRRDFFVRRTLHGGRVTKLELQWWRSGSGGGDAAQQAGKYEADDLRMAPVHAVAAYAGDAGNATAVLADDESCASPRIQASGGRVARHGHFRWLFAAARTVSRCTQVEMDSLDSGGRSAADVSRVAGFRHRGDESQRDFFRSHGGAHDGAAAGAGAKSSRLGAGIRSGRTGGSRRYGISRSASQS